MLAEIWATPAKKAEYECMIRAESWEKFRPALKKMKMSIVIQH